MTVARSARADARHLYGEHFVLPQAVVDEEVAVLAGLDGRTMSKSYDNVIPVFQPTNALSKLIMRIKTNSLAPGAPEDPDTCTLFAICRAFADAEQVAALRERYAAGIGWGDMRQLLNETIDAELKNARTRYDALMEEPARIEEVLQAGAMKARAISAPFLQRLRHAVGLRPLHEG